MSELTAPTHDTAAVGVDHGGEVAKCPFPHHLLGANSAPTAVGTDDAPACPFPLAAGPGDESTDAPNRSAADRFVRKVLFVKERPPGMSKASALKVFEKSMLISATRCTLTYVIFPFVLPMLHLAEGVGPVVGIVIGCVAMVSDVFTIRRFFTVDHKWRWYFSSAAFCVICLLTVLLVQDIAAVL
ncbi:MAG: hypothetical protein R2698_00755 [Microthrixaceae bacterium]